MATHKSAKKRNRQNKVLNLRNRSLRSSLKTELKKFFALLADKKIDEAKTKLSFMHKKVDSSCTKGILTKNKASRTKSKLSKAVFAS